MLALVVAAALLWAMRPPMPWSLAAYLTTQFVYLVVMEISWRLIGPGGLYGAIYAAASVLVFATIGRLAWESLVTARYRTRCLVIGAMLAALFARLAYVGMGRQAEWFDWMVIAEGALLVCGGVLAGMSAPYTAMPDITLGLGTLWMAQALIAFGFCLHYPAWVKVDVYARAIVAAVGFLYLGWRLRYRLRRVPSRASQAVPPAR